MATPIRVTIIGATGNGTPGHGRAAGGGASGGGRDIEVAAGPLAVRSRTLSGGLSEGVRDVELVAGSSRVHILPDRGLGIWKVNLGGTEFGWQSPVCGPVHPAFVPLSEPSGLGWLDGFDELVARCGLVSNGAPDFTPEGRLRHGLHGRIANIPARSLEVDLDELSGTLTARGTVDETRFLCHSLRMNSELSMTIGSPRVAWTDTVVNLSDRPTTMQMLYHINFGLPLLGRDAEVVAAIDELAPRDAGAVADVPTWNHYAEPRSGRLEEVHYCKLHADATGTAAVLLVAPGGRQAAKVSWNAATLPWFALWKNQGGQADGYVTGIEPATNFPNARSFEESQGRVVTLPPGGSVAFSVAIEHVSAAAIPAAREAILAAAGGKPATIHNAPRRGWSAGAVLTILFALGACWGAGGNSAAAADPARTAVQTGAPRRVIAGDDSRRTLAAMAADGSVEWKRPNGAIHDLHLLPDGHLLFQDGWTRIIEIDADGHPVWEYDAQGGENTGRPVEVHAFQRLPDGGTMVVESGPARILEVGRNGKVRKSIPLVVKNPAVHSDTRNARTTPEGTYLVAHERDGAVREYDATGKVIWEYDVPLFGKEPQPGHGPEAFGNQIYSAVRLASGNTLIGTGNGHGVLEVTPEKEIVWRIDQHDLPGITLAWVTQVRRLANGNTQLINCHAGPDNPQIIEVTPEKKVVWTFRDFETFGDSMPVAVVLDP